MLNQRDVLSVCLFDRNELLMHALIAEAAPRVAAMGTPAAHGYVQQLMNKSALSVEDCTVVFLTILSRDVVLKAKIINGIPQKFLHGMNKEKAAKFFLYLDRDILMPWLHDEGFPNAAMIDKCKEMFILS
jgi:hypothetical protein